VDERESAWRQSIEGALGQNGDIGLPDPLHT
jgi:hypothetical protein